MIRVTIQMIPRGDESRARHMGTVEIANDGTGDQAIGNYKVRLSRMDSSTRAWKTGAIRGFNRKTRGPHDLLLLALLSTVGDRNQRVIDALAEEAALIASTPSVAPAVPVCHRCDLPHVTNPHPEAGKPAYLLEVGCPTECLPCLVKSRHEWSLRASRAEKLVRDYQVSGHPVQPSGEKDL